MMDKNETDSFTKKYILQVPKKREKSFTPDCDYYYKSKMAEEIDKARGPAKVDKIKAIQEFCTGFVLFGLVPATLALLLVEGFFVILLVVTPLVCVILYYLLIKPKKGGKND